MGVWQIGLILIVNVYFQQPGSFGRVVPLWRKLWNKRPCSQIAYVRNNRQRSHSQKLSPLVSVTIIFMPPKSKIGGGGAYCFCPDCHSGIAILSETLTLLITFEHWVLELWYYKWVFLVIRHFYWYLTFWPWHLTFLKDCNWSRDFKSPSRRA